MAFSYLNHTGLVAALAVSFHAAAATLPAQIVGAVHDPADQPIAQATVALWRGGREVARTTSDEAGRFRFSADTSSGATVLLVRRIGFRPASVSLGDESDTLTLTLEPVPAALPAVIATAARRACPNRDEPGARELWRALSARYATHPHTDGLWAVMYWRHGQQVPAAEVGEIDESRLPPGEYAIDGDIRRAYFTSLQRDGYARRLKPGDGGDLMSDGLYFHWRYLPLHRELSEHFVEADFATRHTLGLWRESDGSFTLSFCGRDKSRPYLEGTLSISSDTSLQRARWRFRTPGPNEDAGAEVSFLSPTRGARVWLLIPLRSVFWRRLGGSRTLFVQEASVYREWHMCLGAFRRTESNGWVSQQC
jgi:hypothetical protein